MTVRPRRSVLYMPGLNERALEKAKSLPADALILDLEDSVAPEGKVAARENVCAAVKGGGYGRRELVIRVNAIETSWGMDDLRAAASRGARRHPGAESGVAGRHRHRRQGARRHQRPRQGASVGDDGDAELGAECARDRRNSAPTRRTGSPASSWAPTIC